jgi:hypothetical protein
VELMANISADIRADGKLDNPALGSRLVDNAKTLHRSQIRKNLEGKYAETSQSVTIPYFEQYVRQFLENTPYQPTTDQPSGITYPVIGQGGINILADEVEMVKPTEGGGFLAAFSARADLAEGSSLKVVISGKMGDLGLISATNWSAVNSAAGQFTLTSIESGRSADAAFCSYSNVHIEYYENGAITPTKVKNVYIGASAEEDDAREREMLIAFYQSTNGDKWIRNDNWCSDKPVSLWYGIKTIYHTASSKSHVYSIELPNNNLTGTAYITDFTFLDGLNILNGNKLESLMIDNCGKENRDPNFDNNTVFYHDNNYSQVHLKTLKITNSNGNIYVHGNFSAENVIISDCKLSSQESIIFSEPSTMVGTLTVSNCMMGYFSAGNSVIDNIIIDSCTFLEEVDGVGHVSNAYIYVGNKTQINNCKGLRYIYSSRDCSDLTITNTICDDIRCNNP